MDRETIKKIRKSVTNIVEWDFMLAEGDTIREKYDSLLDKTAEVSSSLKDNTSIHGSELIITGPEIAAIFETCAYDFVPYKPSEIDLEDKIGQRIFRKPNTRQTDLFIEHIGSEVLNFKGVVDARWRLFTDILAPVGEILIGLIPTEEKVISEADPNFFAKILVKNFLD
jgi:hypothetical protein